MELCVRRQVLIAQAVFLLELLHRQTVCELIWMD